MTFQSVSQQIYLSMSNLLDDCPIGVSVVTREPDAALAPGDRIYANPQLVQMFGYSDIEGFTQAPVEKSWADKASLARFEQTLNRGEKVINFEAERVRKDGSKWWALLNSQPLTVDERNFTLVWHIDITERKRAETELKFRGEIFDNMSEGVAVVETTGRKIVYTNPVFETMFGYGHREMVGLPVSALNAHTDKSPENVAADIQKDIDKDGYWSGEIENRRKDGTIFWCHVNVTPFHHPDYGKADICVQTDITQRKLAEIALNKANHATRSTNEALKRKTDELSEEIEQHKKTEDSLRQAKAAAEAANQSKSEFLAHMSHELRTPLNAIIGFSDMIRNQVLGAMGNNVYEQYIDDIHTSGYHLLQVINDVLDISKIEAGEQSLREQDFYLDELLRSSVRMIRGRKDAQFIDIDYTPADQIQVNADYRLLKQLVLNILSNAVKYNNDGGRVDVSAAEETNFAVAITITDNGIGVAEDDLQKILVPFGQARSSTHVSHEGTGLGLSLSKMIAELHGGQLDLESQLGVGTTVTIRLPPERNTGSLR